MQAIVYRRYGSPDVLERSDVGSPTAGDDQVVVRVHATGINPFDLHFIYGDPYLMRPMMGTGLRRPKAPRIPGSDVAGVVESAGKNVTKFRPGDEVFATVGAGGLAPYVAVTETMVARKPSNSSFAEAASVPMAATTALQSVRDFGALKTGQRVLVNGASGGVGSFAVQVATALGAADVTGVCGPSNLERVAGLGVGHVIDYTKVDFTRGSTRYDLIVDTVGDHSAHAFARALEPKGTLVIIGAGAGHWLGPVKQMILAKATSPFIGPRVVICVAHSDGDDLAFLAGLIEAGKVRPLVGRTYAFGDAADAFRLLETRHPGGKIVITAADA